MWDIISAIVAISASIAAGIGLVISLYERKRNVAIWQFSTLVWAASYAGVLLAHR
jgi:hypothetical protein